MQCEFCGTQEADTYVEGWFYTAAKHNPYAKGTASAGLLQHRIVCKNCAEEAIKNGMTPAQKIK